MRYYVKGPVADGEFLTEYLGSGLGTWQAIVEFFGDAELKNKVTPSAGTVNLLLSPTGNTFIPMAAGKDIPAAQVYSDALETPSGLGLAIQGKVVLSGVTGANYFQVTFWGI